MGKNRFFKYISGTEIKLIRYHDGVTDGFVNNKWMREPSLLYKINGKIDEPTLQEISEDEAMKIAGVRKQSKAMYYFSFLIPILIIIVLVFALKIAFQNYKSNKRLNELMNSSNRNSLIADLVKLNDGEKLLFPLDTEDNKDNEYNKIYNELLPKGLFYNNSIYDKSGIDINTIDSRALYEAAYNYCLNNDFACEYISSDNGIYSYSSESLKKAIKNLFNFDTNTIPDYFYFKDKYYICKLNNDIYNCSLNEELNDKFSFVSSNIIKITEDEYNIYIYDGSVYIKDKVEKDGETHFQAYRYIDATDLITDCSKNSCIGVEKDGESNNAYDAYSYKGAIFKHTFRKSNGNYSWQKSEFYREIK